MRNLSGKLFPILLLVIPLVFIGIIAWIWLAPNYSSSLASTSNLAVAAATLELAIIAYMQIRSSREERIYSDRPIIIPSSRFHFTAEFWEAPKCSISITNVGKGVALNIHGVIFSPDNPQLNSHSHYSYSAAFPLASEQEDLQVWFYRNGTRLSTKDKIGRIQLGIPIERRALRKNLAMDENIDDYVLRLSFTYHDVYEKKYASVFDYLDSGKWVSVSFPVNLDEDLFELDHKK